MVLLTPSSPDHTVSGLSESTSLLTEATSLTTRLSLLPNNRTAFAN